MFEEIRNGRNRNKEEDKEEPPRSESSIQIRYVMATHFLGQDPKEYARPIIFLIIKPTQVVMKINPITFIQTKYSLLIFYHNQDQNIYSKTN